MKNYKAENVDQYIASSVPEAREKLEELRELVKSSVPGAQESISWGVPFYKYHGVLAGFATQTHHISFGLVTVLSEDDRKALETRGYPTGMKTIQIKFDQKVPTAIIKKILKAKAKANEAKG